LTWLENRIPPPLMALIIAALMWLAADIAPGDVGLMGLRIGAALVVILCAGILLLPAVVAFRTRRTTVNPVKIDEASVLVTDGVYRLTRNPMYLGLVLLLVAWTLFIGSFWALLGPIALVLYLTRFQIKPEERVLGKIFGQPYAEYCNRVRRWI
jgi:protein-S-isoprenylcysteine O-methyltransferase Ste14